MGPSRLGIIIIEGSVKSEPSQNVTPSSRAIFDGYKELLTLETGLRDQDIPDFLIDIA